MAAIVEAELSLDMGRLALHSKAAPKIEIQSNDDCKSYRTLSTTSPTPVLQISIAPSDIQMDCQVGTIPKLRPFCRLIDIYADCNDEELGAARACYVDRLPLKILNPQNFQGSLQLLHTQSDGFTLCNRDGTTQSKPMMYPWSKEINYGAVLVLQLLFHEKEYRRQGMAQALLEAQIQMTEKQKSGLRFMFVKPGVFLEDVEEQIHDDMSLEEKKEVGRRAYANAVRFYRAVGFRRAQQ